MRFVHNFAPETNTQQNMKRKTFLLILAALPLFGFAQRLTFGECQKLAHDNYPAIRQYGMVESMRDYTVSNAAKGWLPQVSVQGGAYAFTDIISANEQTGRMGIDMKNYVASGSVSVRQTIYDGGQTAAAKGVAKAQAEVQQRQLDVTMHDVNERVEQLFFGILTIDEQLRQNGILQNDLGVSNATVESLVKGGLANQSDLDAVSVEMMKAEQQADALKASRKAYMAMLGVFIGKPLDESAELEKPSAPLPIAKDQWGLLRPELAFYASQNQLLESQRKQLDARLRPTVGFTGIGLLHTRVSDMVHDGMLMGGISLSWNIGALYTRKNDIRKLDIQRQQNDNMRETFLFNNRLQNEETDGSMQSLRRQLDKDAQIVSLRERIRQTNEKKVRLGTETVNELLRSVNAVSMARQQQSLHELQLLQTIYHSQTINGK